MNNITKLDTSTDTSTVLQDFTVLENGDCFMSQREAARLVGMSQNAVRNFYGSNNIDVKQGLNPENLLILVQHYSRKGSAEALETLFAFGRAGAKAFIYAQAGYTFDATPRRAPAKETPLLIQSAPEVVNDMMPNIIPTMLPTKNNAHYTNALMHALSPKIIWPGDFQHLSIPDSDFIKNIILNRLRSRLKVNGSDVEYLTYQVTLPLKRKNRKRLTLRIITRDEFIKVNNDAAAVSGMEWDHGYDRRDKKSKYLMFGATLEQLTP
jgi:hypothetical protein